MKEFQYERRPAEEAKPDFRAVFEAAEDCALVLDPGDEMMVLAATRRFLEWIGKAKTEVVNRPLAEVLPFGPDDAAFGRLLASLEHARSERSPHTVSVPAYGDGVTHIPVMGDQEVAYIIQRVRTGKQDSALEPGARSGAGSKSDDKLEFVQDLSDRLAELAGLVAGPADSLSTYSNNLTERQRREISTMAKNAMILLRHTRELTEMMRLERGLIRLSYSRVNLADLVSTIANRFEDAASARQIQFIVSGPDRAQAQVDQLRMERVILNLLTHAFKSVQKSGTIACRFWSDPDRATVEVAVRPTRIDHHAAGSFLERFGGLRGSPITQSGEAGLGLAIASDYVRLHRGQLTLEDASADGVTFRVEIPPTAPAGRRAQDQPAAFVLQTDPLLIQGALEELEESPLGRPAVTPEPLKALVLVVEDERATNQVICAALENEFRVVSSPDGRDALEKAMELKPDLILTDLTMPRMDGERLIAEIRRRPGLAHVPIIVISGNTDEELRVKLLRESVQDYVTKPLNVEELRARTRNQVMIKRTRDILEDDLSLTSETLEGLARQAALQKREFEASNRLRDEFVATLSHDLRTPLTSIHGWVRLLRMQHLSAEARTQAMESIERNTKVLTSNVEDLLDLSRIVTGKVDLEVQMVELPPILGRVIEAVRKAADAKEVSIRSFFAAECGMVLGDPKRLEQVATHLIENAVKFARPGGQVEVRLEPTRAHVELRVRDDGMGISPEFLPYVFDSFRQADGTTTRTHPGLGLGLSIVRAVVELHGGTVEATSEGVGHGAIFSIRLPMLTPGKGGGTAEAPVRFFETSDDLNGINVLLVEDDPDTRAFLTVVLEQGHARVRAYSLADEVLEAFREWRPDVLVCDIGLPYKDGYELMREIRGMESGSRVPAIALTAYTSPEDRDRARAAGFETHVSKPVDPAELVRIIAEYARRE